MNINDVSSEEPNILNMKEDLLGDEPIINIAATTIKTKPVLNQRKSIKPKKRIASKPAVSLLTAAAKAIGVRTQELQAWLDQTLGAPELVKQNCLRLIYKYELDPFTGEVAIYSYDDGHWQASINIDGWAKLINNHPAFNGIAFTESAELIQGIPAWMMCTIYRQDRIVPTEVKEYLCEIKTEHSIWKEMPRRMLRHRVIAQCARLAFGVSVPEPFNLISSPKEKMSAFQHKNQTNPRRSHVELLKSQLAIIRK